MKFFVASNDSDMLQECIFDNRFIKDLTVEYDNMKDIGLPYRYNRFIDRNIDNDSWLVMMHDDVCLLEPIPNDMPNNQLYGLIGAVKENGKGTLFGKIRTVKSDRYLGEYVPHWKEVTTCDPLCIIAHTTLLRSSGLRFDENLTYHLHFEELSIRARKMDIKTAALQVDAIHYSMGVRDDEFNRSWKYVTEKHKITTFVSPISKTALDNREEHHWV